MLESYVITKNWEPKNKVNIFLLKVHENIHFIDLDIIPKGQKNEIAKYHQKNDREKRLLARSFLFEYSKFHYQINDFDFIFNQYFQPKFKISEIKFSLSYSGEYILVGISLAGEIGVDVEYKKEDLDVDEIAPLIMHSSEMSYFQALGNKQSKLEFFYKLWSGKESLIKAFGTGLHHPIKDIDLMNVEKFSCSNQGKKYECSSIEEINKYALSYALEMVR